MAPQFSQGNCPFLAKIIKDFGMSVPSAKNLWRVLAVISVVVFAYATVLGKLTRDWWTDENYSHGLLIPFVIGYVLWIQRDKFASEPLQPSLFWGSAAVLFALFALWDGVP